MVTGLPESGKCIGEVFQTLLHQSLECQHTVNEVRSCERVILSTLAGSSSQTSEMTQYLLVLVTNTASVDSTLIMCQTPFVWYLCLSYSVPRHGEEVNILLFW